MNKRTVLITGANLTTAVFAPMNLASLAYLAILLQDTADGPMTLEGHPHRDGYAVYLY